MASQTAAAIDAIDRPMTTRGSTVEGPAEVHLEKPLNSHREHRITVPMPRSLDELRGHAQRRFRNGRGLYHHGRRQVSHPNHMAGVKHDDVVVVAIGRDEEHGPPPTTTNRSHYVRHEPEPRPASPPDPHPGEPGKWYGESRYGTDFAPRAYTKPAPSLKPPDGLRVGRGPTGKTSYRAQYPWHDAAKPDRRTNYELHTRPAPFDGASSYQTDFNATHPQPRPRSLATPRERPIGGGDFYGNSTYGAHFRHPDGARAASPLGTQPSLALGHAPFDGNSEYTHRYVKHPHEAREVLHIEPQKHD